MQLFYKEEGWEIACVNKEEENAYVKKEEEQILRVIEIHHKGTKERRGERIADRLAETKDA